MTEPTPIPPDLPQWRVNGDQIKTETTLAPGMSGLQQVHVIPYTILTGPARGLVREVRVAPADFTPGNVQEAIVEDLSTVHGITQLGTPGA